MTAPRSVGPQVTSQAVLSPLTDAAIFLVATVREDGETGPAAPVPAVEGTRAHRPFHPW